MRTHLIWSEKWGAWHKRCDNDGAARGYTKDILSAGIFETETALDYHEPGINKAVPLADARKRLDREIARLEVNLADAKQKFCTFANYAEAASGRRFAALATGTRRAETRSKARAEGCQSGGDSRNAQQSEPREQEG